MDLRYLGADVEEYQENIDSQLHSLLTQLCLIGVILVTLIASAVFLIAMLLRKRKANGDDSDVIPGTPEIR